MILVMMTVMLLQKIGAYHGDVIGVGGIVALAVVDDNGDADADVVTEDCC